MHFKPGITITPTEQDELLQGLLEFGHGITHCIIYTADEFVSFSPEARKRAEELEPATNYIASATVAHNLAYMIIANFYVRYNKPKKPFKNFSKEESALQWLRGFIK